jgi:hypothetical protein
VVAYSSFIIVAQPSVLECVAATKYEKYGDTYSAKLHTRIICLLDPSLIEKHFTLSNVGKALNIYLIKITFSEKMLDSIHLLVNLIKMEKRNRN